MRKPYTIDSKEEYIICNWVEMLSKRAETVHLGLKDLMIPENKDASFFNEIHFNSTFINSSFDVQFIRDFQDVLWGEIKGRWIDISFSSKMNSVMSKVNLEFRVFTNTLVDSNILRYFDDKLRYEYDRILYESFCKNYGSFYSFIEKRLFFKIRNYGYSYEERISKLSKKGGKSLLSKDERFSPFRDLKVELYQALSESSTRFSGLREIVTKKQALKDENRVFYLKFIIMRMCYLRIRILEAIEFDSQSGISKTRFEKGEKLSTTLSIFLYMVDDVLTSEVKKNIEDWVFDFGIMNYVLFNSITESLVGVNNPNKLKTNFLVSDFRVKGKFDFFTRRLFGSEIGSEIGKIDMSYGSFKEESKESKENTSNTDNVLNERHIDNKELLSKSIQIVKETLNRSISMYRDFYRKDHSGGYDSGRCSLPTILKKTKEASNQVVKSVVSGFTSSNPEINEMLSDFRSFVIAFSNEYSKIGYECEDNGNVVCKSIYDILYTIYRPEEESKREIFEILLQNADSYLLDNRQSNSKNNSNGIILCEFITKPYNVVKKRQFTENNRYVYRSR